MTEPLRIIPLGGVGEVGKNITLIEAAGRILVVDCGLAFPEPEMLGIDLVIPDITYLEANRDRVIAIALTHGHEDHTGALPFVLPKLPGVPVYAGRLTSGLVRGKLKEHRLLDQTPLEPLEAGVEMPDRPVQHPAVPREPFDPGRDGLRHPYRGGDGGAHRRLQVRPHAAGRGARRPGADRRDRESWRGLPAQRLHPFRKGGLHAVGGHGGGVAAPAGGGGSGARDRGDLRQQHRARAAGARRGRGARPQDGGPGTQHGAEHVDRGGAWLPGPAWRHAGPQGPAAAPCQ